MQQQAKNHSIIGLLLGVFLLATAGPVLGREVSGPVQGKAVWEGEISFSRTVEVPAGAELEIRAGTRVKPLTPEAGILVAGVLRVVGSKTAPVLFDSPPQWTGIEFAQGTPGSLIEYAHFQGGQAAVTSSLNAFTLRHSSFKDYQTAVKLLRQSNPRIEGCRFENNDLGVDIEMKSAPELVGNRFIGHRQTAILATHNSAGLIERNILTGNRQGIGLLRGVLVKVVDNEFRENEIGLYCEQTRNTPVVSGNHFSGNRNAMINYSYSSPRVDNNQFTANDTAVRNDQLGMPRLMNNHFRRNRVALHNLRRSEPEVSSNLFEANEVAIICDYSSYPKVKNNNFINNAMGVRLGLHQSADREKQLGSSGVVLAMSARRKGLHSMLPALTAEFDDFVDVRNNWWGKDTELLAAANAEGNVPIFFDRHDHPRLKIETSGSATYLLDRVEFSPWLSAPAAGAGVQGVSP